MRAETRPAPSAVASVMAVGSGSLASCASCRRSRKVSRISGISMIRHRFGYARVIAVVETRVKLDDASTRLFTLCTERMAHTHRPWMLALSGLPGSGKSTLAKATLSRARREGWPALTLSLDDFYLPRRARKQLAAHVHPLLLTRGVPGTHDLALLRHVLQRLPDASDASPVAVPRFDKGRDTRQPPSRWRKVRRAPRLVILEGWCL